MDIENYFIPKTLDDPNRILLFTTKEVAILSIWIFLLILSSNPIFFFIAIASIFIGRKLKKKVPYSISQLAYWHLDPYLSSAKYLPKSYQRNFISN